MFSGFNYFIFALQLFTNHKTLSKMTQVNEAQKELNTLLDMYWSIPENQDGGSYEDRLRIKYEVASRYNLDPVQEESLYI